MDKIIEKKTGWQTAFTKKALPWWIGSALVLLIIYLIIKPNQSTLRINGETLTISTVRQGEFNDYIRLSGTVQPLVTIQISPVEGGIVQEILIEEGSTVKKGDEILRLSNDNLDLQILNSEAELAEKENILRNTQIQMEQDRLNVKQQKAEYQLNVKRLKRTYEQQKSLYKDKPSRHFTCQYLNHNCLTLLAPNCLTLNARQHLNWGEVLLPSAIVNC